MGSDVKEVKGFTEYTRKAGADGIVLLKNSTQMLPLNINDELAVFGRCQIDYYRSGTGSGGSVNVPYAVNAIDGIKNSNSINHNSYLEEVYRNFVVENPFQNGGGGWAAEPWFQTEMVLTEDIVKKARTTSNKGVVIIGRTAGEEHDNKNRKGSYLLTDLEMQMLLNVAKHFSDIAVVLNVSNIIDMSWLDNDQLKNSITAVLYSWQGGIEGGNALADILSGDVTPSGKLTNTIAYELEMYPSHKNFGNETKNIYQEDIYLGYRYFETFNKDAVRFPFGYGLTYTDFKLDNFVCKKIDNGINSLFEIEVNVTNIGDKYSGREVVQLYYSAPQGKLGKPAMELGGFNKTDLLKPGESQILTIKIPLSRMASYDDAGLTGFKSAYVLEEGEYKLFLGNSIRNVELIKSETLDLLVVEELNESMCPTVDFKRMKPGNLKSNGEYEVVYEDVPKRVGSLKERMTKWLPQEYKQTGDLGIKLQDVKDGKHSLESFVAQLSQSELETIVRGEGMGSPRVTSGTAGAFGGVGDNLQKYGIPATCAADGPSGIRMDSGEKAIQLPIGTLLASSWDTKMVLELYTFEGKELVLNNIDTLLGPGMNIHRHPLNGRNFEYFSEDPFLTGCMAKATTLGLKKGGATGTVKHFACNDQEHNRSIVDSIISERALREIHLKGFEIAVKEGDTKSLMTAYNPINGIWAASNYDLNTTILRKEWGYTGIVMTDWWAKMNDPINGGEATIRRLSCMVRSQNDIFMLVNNFGAEVNSLDDDQFEAIKNGELSIAELQRCAINICRFITNTKAMDRPIKAIESRPVEPLEKLDYNGEIFPVDSDLKFNSTENKSSAFRVEIDGVYNIITCMMHDHDPSAQSSCNILLNGKVVTNIQLNGTFGRWVKEKNIPLFLKKGLYRLDLEITKAGLEIDYVSFQRK
ncbi:MAG: glycoside hydrolase family 3 C-terminal domain-containing protein [Spirochaetaceae bacterium]